jgi:RND family efflux transporter, MFP subunit
MTVRLGLFAAALFLCPLPGMAADYLPGDTLRVELKAPTLTIISSPTAGEIEEIAVRDGDLVTREQVLVRFDSRLARLRLDSTTAMERKARTLLDTTERLHALNSRGKMDVDLARAEHAAAVAEMDMARLILERLCVRAPFDGRITAVGASKNQYTPEGSPLLEIAEHGPMELEFMIPSSRMREMRPGTGFRLLVEETGKGYEAEIVRFGGKVDAVTQSVKVYGKLKTVESELLPGMSGIVNRSDFPLP